MAERAVASAAGLRFPKVTTWRVVWVDKRTGKGRVTIRRSARQAERVAKDRVSAGHTGVRYKAEGVPELWWYV